MFKSATMLLHRLTVYEWITILLLIAILVAASLGTGDRQRAKECIAEAQLRARVDYMNLKAVPLTEALRRVEKESGSLRVCVNWEELAKEGVTPDSPTTVRLRDAKLSRLIRHILDDVGAGTGRVAYRVRDGRIEISSERYLLSQVTVRRYDIRDLLIRPTRNDKLVDVIVTLLEDCVASDTWKSNGGQFAEIRYVDGWLEVTQTDDAHQQLRRLLNEIRETRSDRTGLRVISCEFSVGWN